MVLALVGAGKAVGVEEEFRVKISSTERKRLASAPAAASKRRDRRNAILFIEDDDDAHTVYFEKPIDDDIRQTGGICQ